MKQGKKLLTGLAFSALVTTLITIACARTSTTPRTGSVIFIHPDGSSPSHWGAARLLHYGPNRMLAVSSLCHWRPNLLISINGILGKIDTFAIE